MTGIDWNAAAKQMGIYDASQLKGTNTTGTVSQGATQVSAPSFQGGLQLAGQPAYDQYQPSKSSGGGVVTAVGLLATAGTIAYFARRGKMLKHGKFGGSIGDWIRNIGKKGKDGLTDAQVRHLRDIQAKIIKDSKSVLADKEATAEAKKAAEKAIKDAKAEGAKLKKAHLEGSEAAGKPKGKSTTNNPLANAQDNLTKLEAQQKASEKRLNVINTILRNKDKHQPNINSVYQKYNLPKDTNSLQTEAVKEKNKLDKLKKAIENVQGNIRSIQTGSSVSSEQAKKFNESYFSAESRIGK